LNKGPPKTGYCTRTPTSFLMIEAWSIFNR
jgi:hypothetical protein